MASTRTTPWLTITAGNLPRFQCGSPIQMSRGDDTAPQLGGHSVTQRYNPLLYGPKPNWVGRMGRKMPTNLKQQPSAGTHRNQVAKPSRRGSRAHADSPSSAGRAVTPTSERIIKETSVKRRKAMEVLANR